MDDLGVPLFWKHPCCESPILTWGPRDFNLIGNPELANCNELLRVKGGGLWPGSPPKVSKCPTITWINLCTAVQLSLYSIQHCIDFICYYDYYTSFIRFETIASGSDGWVVFNCLWLESPGAPVIYRTSAPSATWMHEDVEMMDCNTPEV